MALAIKKIISSSLVEVLIAMVLISLSICMAAMIFTQVSGSREQHRKVEAIIRINSVINDNPVGEQPVNEDFVFSNMIVRQEKLKAGEENISVYSVVSNDSTSIYKQKHYH